jgi:hypothetical protein
MKMYIGRYWVPFPRSEYGGMWSVIANNQEECVKILEQSEKDYNEEYFHLIPEVVEMAHCFELDKTEKYEPQLVHEFTT